MENGPTGTGSERPPLPPLGEKKTKEKDGSSKESKTDGSREIPKAPLDKLLQKEVKAAPKETISQRLGIEKASEESSDKKDEVPTQEALEKHADHAAEGGETDDTMELPLDAFTPEEGRQFAEEVIFDRHQQVSEELAQAVAGSEHAEAAGADKNFLETAQEQLNTTEAGVAEALDSALETTEAQLRAEVPAETSTEAKSVEAKLVEPEGSVAATTPETPSTTAASSSERSYTPTAAAAIPVEVLSNGPSGPETRAGGGAGAPPEKPPKATSGNEWYPPAEPWSRAAWDRRLNHYMRHRYERLKTKREIKKTEKRLEQQMHNISHEVTSRENTVRNLAVEQARLRKSQKEAAERTDELKQAMQGLPERQRYVASLREAIMPPPPTPPERYVAKASEALVPRGPVERPTGHTYPEGQSATEERHPAARAEAMSHEDLLRESAGITVAGVTLRSMYEDKRIGEPGLRRLVDLHERGGKNMEVALAKEMVEHERSFELDPILREEHPAHEWLQGSSVETVSAFDAAQQSTPTEQTGPGAANADTQKTAPSHQQRVSDAQFMTAGFTILIIIVVIIAALILSR